MKNETALSVVAKAIVDDAWRAGFEAAKAAVQAIMRRSIEDPNGYTLRGEHVVRGLIDVISELKPEVPQ